MQAATLQLADRLSTLSTKNRGNPYHSLAGWPETFTAGADWHFAEKLSSLHGTPLYDELNEEQRKRLGFYEAINFYSLNIHGERALMEGLAARLYRKWPSEVTQYLHHFLGEENNHMVLFGNFCVRYAGRVYPDRHMVFAREYAPGEEDFLFFAKVLIFEEVVDFYNYTNANDATLHPVAREINRLHREDEARHLAFGRKLAAELYQMHSPGWSDEKRKEVGDYLKSYLVATLREYYNPDMYKDAGLSDPYGTVSLAWKADSSRQRRRETCTRLLHFFRINGIWTEEPEL